MADLTVIILTLNEEKNIVQAIKSVKTIAKRIVVLDSGSTDNTQKLAEDHGAEFVVHLPWINHATQFNWGIENTGINTEWILRLDADEVITPEGAKEIEHALEIHANDDVNGFEFKMRLVFMGKWLKYSGCYPLIISRLWRRGHGCVEKRNMDEHALIDGKVLRFKHDMLHLDFKSIDDWINKHNKYATREMMDYYDRMEIHERQETPRLLGAQRQRRRFLKNGVYYNLPKFFRAHLYFIYRYYFRLGFLDGVHGKIYCFLQAYWYRFLVDTKIFEKEHAE